MRIAHGPAVIAVTALLAGLLAPWLASAQPPRLDVRPPALDLGTISPGETASGLLQVHNVGGLPLTVQRVSVDSGPFSVSSQGPYTFPPGTFWAITVIFAPGAPGTYSATVTIESNDPLGPVVRVPVTGNARQAGPAVTVLATPPSVSLAPGTRRAVIYTIRETAGVLTEIAISAAYLELGDGRRLPAEAGRAPWRLQPFESVDVPAFVELPSSWLAIARTLDPAMRQVRFVREFTASAAGGRVEEMAAVEIEPLGSLGADLTVTGVSVTAPVAGSALSQDARVHAEGHVFGSGNGPVTGAWLVDGVVVERFTADLWGGQPVRVVSLQSLPALSAGRHELVLEIVEPRSVRSPPVNYLVTPGTSHDFRLLRAPGFPTYLKSGTPPTWSWTPRPATSAFDIVIDGEVIDRVRVREWSLPDPMKMNLAAGDHEIEVRAIATPAPSTDGGDPAVLASARSRFTLLDTPSILDISVTDETVVWRGPDGAGLFAVVLLDERGATVRRKITQKTTAARRELAALAAGSLRLRVRVDALNDFGEVVATSAIHELVR